MQVRNPSANLRKAMQVWRRLCAVSMGRGARNKKPINHADSRTEGTYCSTHNIPGDTTQVRVQYR